MTACDREDDLVEGLPADRFVEGDPVGNFAAAGGLECDPIIGPSTASDLEGESILLDSKTSAAGF